MRGEEEERRYHPYRVWDREKNRFRHDILFASDGIVYIDQGDRALISLDPDPERYIMELATGYTDMYSSLVYEGDILWNTRWPVSQRSKIVIEWTREEDAQLEMVGFLVYADEGWEIIGNVHETPDLLEKKRR